MSTRTVYLLGFFAICFLLLASLYLQFSTGMQPCPLCTLQRICFVLMGGLFLIGIFTYARRTARIIINVLATLLGCTGIGLASRQIWLQLYPYGNGTQCGVSLQYMMKVLPFNEFLKKLFEGSAECSERGWEFLHLNVAEWSLVCFVLLLGLMLYLFLKESQHH